MNLIICCVSLSTRIGHRIFSYSCSSTVLSNSWTLSQLSSPTYLLHFRVFSFESCATDHCRLLAQTEIFQERLSLCLVSFILQSVICPSESPTQTFQCLTDPYACCPKFHAPGQRIIHAYSSMSSSTQPLFSEREVESSSISLVLKQTRSSSSS